jgi:hypothetical protein
VKQNGPGALALVAALIVTVLAACNDVYSERPLFTAADAKGAPALKTGLWVMLDPKCQFDESRATRWWPKCADWMLVRPGQILALDEKPKSWTVYDYVLAAGSQRVMQVAAPDPDAAGAKTAYFFLGVEPIRFDDDGGIAEYREWSTKCGPPPPPSPKGETQRSLTLEPLAGLQPAPDADHPDDCLAHDKGAVQNAARASQAWTSAETWRWVRGLER